MHCQNKKTKGILMKRSWNRFKKAGLLLFSFTIFFSLNIHEISASTLHGIIIADTIDLSIGSDIDMRKMSQRLRTISAKSGMKYREIIVKDKTRTQKNVANAVKNLKLGKDDTVIFYYTGHGYRTTSKKNRWPSMALVDDKGIDSFWVLKTLALKKPRFIMVMVDACNNEIPDGAIPTMRSVSYGKKTIDVNYKKLFAKYRGIIITSGSSPGQYSYGGPPEGGVYSTAFWKAFDEELTVKNPKWDNIFKKATTPKMGGGQKPQYEINPKISGISYDTPNDGEGIDDNPVSPDDAPPEGPDDGQGSEVATLDIDAIYEIDPDSLTDDCAILQDMIFIVDEAVLEMEEYNDLDTDSEIYENLYYLIEDMLNIYEEAGDKDGIKYYRYYMNLLNNEDWDTLYDGLYDMLEYYIEGFNTTCNRK